MTLKVNADVKSYVSFFLQAIQCRIKEVTAPAMFASIWPLSSKVVLEKMACAKPVLTFEVSMLSQCGSHDFRNLSESVYVYSYADLFDCGKYNGWRCFGSS